MTPEQRAKAFKDYQTVLQGVPMFDKIRADHPELGEAVGAEKDYGDSRLQFCTGGVIGAKVGDWANTWYVVDPKKPEDFPLV